MVAPWMVGMDLFERVGLKVWFLTCVTYFLFIFQEPNEHHDVGEVGTRFRC